MRVEVDPKQCEANAVCVGLLPEVFEVDDEDVLLILMPEPGPELQELVRQAVDRCPKRALSLHEN